jgi:predicted secreted acid phosphatase
MREEGMTKKPLSTTAVARGDWISACHFHDMTESEVLHEVARRVTELKASAKGDQEKHPLVLFDLDSTLYEVGPRTFQILKEWLASSESARFPEVARALDRLEHAHVGYSIGDTLSAAGLDIESASIKDAIQAIKPFWASRFFTSAYLPYDHAYPGSADFAKKVYELGAEIVYLTGRDQPGMGDGTRQNLIRDGFPWEVERTHLLLKAAAHLPDLQHKVDAAEYIRRHGTLVASFENEPPNIAALYEVFPDAMHVFVDTVYSDHCAMPRQGLYRIKGFR